MPFSLAPMRAPLLPSSRGAPAIRPCGRKCRCARGARPCGRNCPMGICHITRRHPAAHLRRPVHHLASNKANNIATAHANVSLFATLGQALQVRWRQLVVTCTGQGKRVATQGVAIATIATMEVVAVAASMAAAMVPAIALAAAERNNTNTRPEG